MAFDLDQLSASFRLSSSSRQLALIRASLKDYLYVKFVYVWPNFWDRFCLYTLLYIRRKYVIITEKCSKNFVHNSSTPIVGRYFKSSSDSRHFIFKINVGFDSFRHLFKNKMDLVWNTLKMKSFKNEIFLLRYFWRRK